jgi:hypothetical protein
MLEVEVKMSKKAYGRAEAQLQLFVTSVPEWDVSNVRGT